MSAFVSIKVPKNSRVVWSVAIPDGTSSPTRPVGATILRASSAKIMYVLMSPFAVSGKAPERRMWTDVRSAVACASV